MSYPNPAAETANLNQYLERMANMRSHGVRSHKCGSSRSYIKKASVHSKADEKFLKRAKTPLGTTRKDSALRARDDPKLQMERMKNLLNRKKYSPSALKSARISTLQVSPATKQQDSKKSEIKAKEEPEEADSVQGDVAVHPEAGSSASSVSISKVPDHNEFSSALLALQQSLLPSKPPPSAPVTIPKPQTAMVVDSTHDSGGRAECSWCQRVVSHVKAAVPYVIGAAAVLLFRAVQDDVGATVDWLIDSVTTVEYDELFKQ